MFSKILKNVSGFKGNNDIIFVGGKGAPKFNVVYIGGDIQDFECNMDKFTHYSLEKTAEILYNRYNKSNCLVHVYAIRPSLYKNVVQSIFKNFVDFNEDGNPTYKFDQLKSAANQILNLIQSGAKVLMQENSENVSPNPDLPIQLIGFSKGCAVLTQLLYDLSQFDKESIPKPFLKLNNVFWLDSGHNGTAELWPVSSDLIGNVLRSFQCYLHGFATSFQLQRPGRDRASPEFNKFRDILHAVNSKHQCGVLLEDRNNDLETHFEILKEFPLCIDEESK